MAMFFSKISPAKIFEFFFTFLDESGNFQRFEKKIEKKKSDLWVSKWARFFGRCKYLDLHYSKDTIMRIENEKKVYQN